MAHFSQDLTSPFAIELVTEHSTDHAGTATTTISNNVYCSIASHPRHRHQSVEEIRVQDYKDGRGKFVPGPHQYQYLPPSASKDFAVHEGVIAPGSEFVRLALRNDWKEAQERIIPLPEDKSEVFAVYQQWLYGGRIRTSIVDFEPGTMDEYELLVHAYILGEQFPDVGFKDCITDAIVNKLSQQTRFSLRLTDEVFDNTPSHSPLRRLWMDIYYWTGSVEWLDEDTVGQPISPEFMAEFSRFQMRLRKSQSPCPIMIPCNYHQHEAGKCHRESKEW